MRQTASWQRWDEWMSHPSSFQMCCFSGLALWSQAQKWDAEQCCVGQCDKLQLQEERLGNLSSSQHRIPCICKLLSLPGAFHANNLNKEKNKESSHVHGIQPSSQILLHKISLIHKISLFRWYLERQHTKSSQTCRCYEWSLESSITYARVIYDLQLSTYCFIGLDFFFF